MRRREERQNNAGDIEEASAQNFGQMGITMHAERLNQRVRLAILHQNEAEESKRTDAMLELRRELSRNQFPSSIRVVNNRLGLASDSS